MVSLTFVGDVYYPYNLEPLWTRISPDKNHSGETLWFSFQLRIGLLAPSVLEGGQV